MSKSLVEQLRSCARGIGLNLVDQAADRIEELEKALASCYCHTGQHTAEVLGAAPTAPAGYKLVPIEPTEDMIMHGFESAPSMGFSKPEVWDAYEELSGCQQASVRAQLCWAAMLAAAPETWKVLPSPARVTGEMLHQAFPEIPGEKWPLPAARKAVWERFAERVNARIAAPTGELKQEAKE